MGAGAEKLDGMDAFEVNVPLPTGPKAGLNSYIVLGADGPLVIDTGYNVPACRAAIWSALAQIGAAPEEASVFVTHHHADHAGSFANLLDPSRPRLMGAVEKACVEEIEKGYYQSLTERMMREEGLPETVGAQALRSLHQDARPEVFECVRDALALEEGDEVSVGEYCLRAVLTPGHTPGHLCLYEPNRRILFAGDSILRDISPNICFWPGRPGMLDAFLASLDKIGALPLDLCCVAHGRSMTGEEVAARVAKLKEHHRRRLAAIAGTLRKALGGLTAYEITAQTPWLSRNDGFKDLDAVQVFLAMAETLAHLEWLMERGEVSQRPSAGGTRYVAE